jgi:hypothetical protein
MQQFDDQALREIPAILEAPAWGDIEAHVEALEHALRLALEATVEDFLRWEREADDRGYHDEFDVSPEVLASMDASWKQAYIGRLLTTVALMYGGSTAYDEDPFNARIKDGTPAALLHDLIAALDRSIARSTAREAHPRNRDGEGPVGR